MRWSTFMIRFFHLNLCWLLALSSVSAQADHRAAPGPHKVAVVEGEWKDDDREGRSVLWKCYLPADVKTPAPVVLFSHGAGGSRQTNGMLGRHLASHGFASLHLQHEGSDDRAVRANPRSMNARLDPKASEPRFRDIAFVVNELKRPDRLGQLQGRIDPNRIGMSGHSYGGLTAQVVAGQFVNGFDQKLAIPELKGAFILSPSPPRPLYGNEDGSFNNMLMPLFSVTGTEDEAPGREFHVNDRRIPFDRTSNVDQWLLVLNGGTHFTFSGEEKLPRVARRFPGMKDDPNLTANHSIIRAAALAFWQVTLRGDREARRYLDEGEFAKLMGKQGILESKPARN
jgi:predicted dienelactone hydrolase